MLDRERIFALSENHDRAIGAALASIGHDLAKPRALAEAVLRLSDHYLSHPDSSTPWHEPWAQAASLAYFFPLNLARNRAVAAEARRLGFFSGLNRLHDLGSGTGSAIHAFLEAWPGAGPVRASAHDTSAEAMALGSKLPSPRPYETRVARADFAAPPGFMGECEQTLLTASYVLTELNELPKWWTSSEAIAILEPSTQTDGRRLMQWRADLISQGYSIWAPCTHQGDCPLLTRSARDWCHDRIHWQAPKWFLEIEKHLPMKNRTITFSYLLARRNLTPPTELTGLARLTGDTLVEKGKSRQSVCRGPEREFLAWFPQRLPRGTELGFERGNLVRFKAELENRSSELRLKSGEDIEEISPITEFANANEN